MWECKSELGGRGWEYKFGSHSCRVDELILRIFRRRSVRGPPDTPAFHEQMPVRRQEWGVLDRLPGYSAQVSLTLVPRQVDKWVGPTLPARLAPGETNTVGMWQRGRGLRLWNQTGVYSSALHLQAEPTQPLCSHL